MTALVVAAILAIYVGSYLVVRSRSARITGIPGHSEVIVLGFSHADVSLMVDATPKGGGKKLAYRIIYLPLRILDRVVKGVTI